MKLYDETVVLGGYLQRLTATAASLFSAVLSICPRVEMCRSVAFRRRGVNRDWAREFKVKSVNLAITEKLQRPSISRLALFFLYSKF